MRRGKHLRRYEGGRAICYLRAVIPAEALHAVKQMRYPEETVSKALDACLRGHDIKNIPIIDYDTKQVELNHD